jgi:hypothetical protein
MAAVATADPGLVALVLQLTDPNTMTRENALLELSKKREDFPDLAPMLWHSFGTVAALLQEIVSIYPALSPPTLTPAASNRVCNALALLQCVASHMETRSLFLQGASRSGDLGTATDRQARPFASRWRGNRRNDRARPPLLWRNAAMRGKARALVPTPLANHTHL